MSVPRATLRRCVTVAEGVTPRVREGSCLLHFDCSPLLACSGQHRCHAPVAVDMRSIPVLHSPGPGVPHWRHTHEGQACSTNNAPKATRNSMS